jgi:hypothetical protein
MRGSTRSWTVRCACFLIAIVGFGLLTPVPVFSQTAPCPDPCVVKPGQAITASFTPTGTNASGFRIWLTPDGGSPAKIGNDIALTAVQNGQVLVPLSAPSATGVFDLTVTAYNAAGESPHSVPARFTVLAPPPAPGKPTLFIAITVAADGTVQFRMVDASQVK